MKKIYLLLLLPLLFCDSPFLIYHQKTIYFPIFFSYLECDFGGDSTLLMDFFDPDALMLIQDALILRSPLWGLEIDFGMPSALSYPTFSHPLGTLPSGEDCLAYLVYAIWITFTQAMILAILSYGMGVLLGTMQAKSNEKISLFLQLLQEIFRSIPLVLVIVLTESKSIYCFLLLFSLTQWPRFAYLPKIHAQSIHKQPFFWDAQYQGLSTFSLYKRYLLPYIHNKTKVSLAHSFVNYFAMITSLSYLGVSLSPNSPSLGKLIYDAQQAPYAPWILIACLVGFSLLSKLALDSNTAC